MSFSCVVGSSWGAEEKRHASPENEKEVDEDEAEDTEEEEDKE
jgi:hypothetical protein